MGAAIILLALSGALALFAEWQYDRSEVFWRGFGESLIFCIGLLLFWELLMWGVAKIALADNLRPIDEV